MHKQEKKFDHTPVMMQRNQTGSFAHKDISTTERWIESSSNFGMVRRSPWPCNHTFEKEESDRKGLIKLYYHCY